MRYEIESHQICGMFLNHDDNIVEETLENGFKETKKLLGEKLNLGLSTFLLTMFLFVAIIGATFVFFFLEKDPFAVNDRRLSVSKSDFKFIGEGYCRSTCSGNSTNTIDYMRFRLSEESHIPL